MQNWTPIALLVAVVVLVTGVAVVIQKTTSLNPQPSPSLTQQNIPSSSATMEPQVPFTLQVGLASESAKVGDNISIVVSTPTTSHTLNGLEAVLNYDPKALKIIDITPGSYFVKPQQLLKKIESNKIRYSVVTFSPSQSGGELMRIQAKLLAKTEKNAIQFDQTKTLVAIVDPMSKAPVNAKQLFMQFSETPFSLLP